MTKVIDEVHDPARPPGPSPAGDDADGGLFGVARRAGHAHPIEVDAGLALALLAFSTVWLVLSPFAGWTTALLQAALIVPLAWRRVHPSGVLVAVSAVAFLQYLLGYQLIGDAALLVALYTVAAHEGRGRAAMATGVSAVGAVLASLRWDPAGTAPRSLLFLSATVVAALFAGLTVASGSRYLAWLAERAERLEVERDQQATIAATAERTRIAREMHDIVSHSLSVVVTLADGASAVHRTDPGRAADAMAQVSEVGRQALDDMRAMLGVLRTDGPGPDLAPQPGLAQLGALVDRVRATGLGVDLVTRGTPPLLGRAGELTIYRVVQEALTNTLKHARATRAWVTVTFEGPTVEVRVVDDGRSSPGQRLSGHGLHGMQERVSVHAGQLVTGPVPGGGWEVSATFGSRGLPLPA